MNKSKKGMTMIELIVSLALVALIFVGLSIIMRPLTKMNTESKEELDAKQIAQIVMANAKEEIHCATGFVTTTLEEGVDEAECKTMDKDSILANTELTSSQLQGRTVTVSFKGMGNCMNIIVKVYDASRLMYTLNTDVSAMDSTVVYQGEGVKVYYLKRNRCQ